MRDTTPPGLIAGTCPYLVHRERLSNALVALLDREWHYAVGCTKLCVTSHGDPKNPWTHLSPVTVEMMEAAIAAEIWGPR